MLTKFDKFTELENIFVELVIIDDGEDCLIQPLQLFYIMNCHVTQLNYATATTNNSISHSVVINKLPRGNSIKYSMY